MISIVIPAHNEARVIARCLTAILEGASPLELEIIVVCNGCGDDTAAIARGFGEAVRVIETPVASKSNALNLGDQAANVFPRFYVDADVVLSHEAITEVAKALEQGQFLAAAPMAHFATNDCPWSVRAFYKVWSQLPYMRHGMIGSGVYALSEAGRKRFESFPAITADDAFVRLQFSAQERLTVESCTFTVSPPRSLSRLIDIKTRSHFGNYELRRQFPELRKNEEVDHSPALRRLALDLRLWPALTVYLYVKVITRARTRWKYAFGNHRTWERDESSRQVAAPAARAAR